VESVDLEFGAVRGAVYYPPSRIMAKLLAPLDTPMSKTMTSGAAFLCIRAHKPSSHGLAKEGSAKGLVHF